jgi:hypothetical protein
LTNRRDVMKLNPVTKVVFLLGTQAFLISSVWGESHGPEVGQDMIHLSTAAEEVRIISRGDEVCNNIYDEMPFMEPSSRYVMYLRLPGAFGGQESGGKAYVADEVWRTDLINQTTERVAAGMWPVRGMAVSPDQRYFYYVSGDSEEPRREVEQLTEVNIATLESRTIALIGEQRRITTMGSIAPGNSAYFAGVFLGPQRYGILEVDIQSGETRIVHEGDAEIFNAHPQVDPGGSGSILIQHNRGAEVDDAGRIIHPYGEMGTTLYLIDLDGGNRRPLHVGRPYGPPIQGHQAWLGKTGSLLFTTHWGPLKERAERGNIWTIRPGDDSARAVARGYTFWHCNTSRCGRYFVADTRGGPVVPNPDSSRADEEPYLSQPIPVKSLIVVGSIATGRTRVLCETQADCTRPQYSHPHPYLSPDRRWVIFNTKKDGIPHVAAARIPDGLLESLEEVEE